MTEKKYTVIETLKYRGQVLGEFGMDSSGKKSFYPLISETEVEDIMDGMDLGTKVDLENEAPEIYMILQGYDVFPEDCISETEANLYFMESGNPSYSRSPSLKNRAKRLEQMGAQQMAGQGLVGATTALTSNYQYQ